MTQSLPVRGATALDPLPSPVAFVLTGLAGAGVGAALAGLVVYPAGVFLLYHAPPVVHPLWLVLPLILHAMAGALCVVLGGTALRVAFRHRPRIGRTSVIGAGGLLAGGLLAGGLLAGGLLSIAPTVAFAATTDSSTALGVVLLEVVVVATLCAAGLLAAYLFIDRRLRAN